MRSPLKEREAGSPRTGALRVLSQGHPPPEPEPSVAAPWRGQPSHEGQPLRAAATGDAVLILKESLSLASPRPPACLVPVGTPGSFGPRYPKGPLGLCPPPLRGSGWAWGPQGLSLGPLAQGRADCGRLGEGPTPSWVPVPRSTCPPTRSTHLPLWAPGDGQEHAPGRRPGQELPLPTDHTPSTPGVGDVPLGAASRHAACTTAFTAQRPHPRGRFPTALFCLGKGTHVPPSGRQALTGSRRPPAACVTTWAASPAEAALCPPLRT